jgi:hypothetical protein
MVNLFKEIRQFLEQKYGKKVNQVGIFNYPVDLNNTYEIKMYPDAWTKIGFVTLKYEGWYVGLFKNTRFQEAWIVNEKQEALELVETWAHKHKVPDAQIHINFKPIKRNFNN